MESTMTLLIGGEFICPVAYPSEFALLKEEQGAQKAQACLAMFGKRLAHLGEAGEESAFFMAEQRISGSAQTQSIRESLARLRDVFGGYIRMIELIRHGKEGFSLEMGERIEVAELELSINRSTTLDSQLRNLQSNIRDTSARLSNRELLKKMLEHLAHGGYLKLENADRGVYIVTGKINHLVAILEVMAEQQQVSTLSTDDSDLQGEMDFGDASPGFDFGAPDVKGE
jgi:hypothetical protein